jgi:arylsulfatase A
MLTRRRFTKQAIIAGMMTAAVLCLAWPAAGKGKPNIVLILADDMGIDSVAALNEKCGIPTPHLDTLLKQGMHFTDAHSGSAVCSPTRYGVLTGRYSWRSRLKRGIVGQWERPLIEADRLTLPGMLKNQGYHTACIGKWHLGWNWAQKGGGFTSKLKDIDFSRATGGGPMTCGFDTYFGDDVPNWPPFVWIENDKTLGIPNKHLTFPKHYYSNNGIGIEGWTLEQVLPKITEKCVEYVNTHAGKQEPFFLYFPMTSPHTPIAPSKAFLGKSGINSYADLLMQTDWCVGQVLEALKANGVVDNTLVIFTTDNGTSPKCNFDELREKNTDLQHHWRGMKADGYEGGHRVPFIVRWPGQITPGTKSDQTISLVDIMATCADAAGVTLPDTAAEDSTNLMPVLKGERGKGPLHAAVICHSAAGIFVVRKGKWKLQFSAGSGGWSLPKDNEALKQGLPKWQLYNLSIDPKETENLIDKHPEVINELTGILRRFIEKGRSTPGTPQKNHDGAIWWKGLPWAQDV